MPLELPDLDDLDFEDLVAEMRSRIPRHAPAWTNHNPSDPGITLIELFAYFGDALLYRLNRVSEANRRAFLRLLAGPDAGDPGGGDLEGAMRRAIRRAREPGRAVTLEDFEALARSADPAVARAIAVADRDLESGNPSPKPGHVSVVVVPDRNDWTPVPDASLLDRVGERLESHRLLGTVVHVVPPRYVGVSIRLAVTPEPGVDPEGLRARVTGALTDHLHPVRGGREAAGWPLGRDVPVSDIYRLVESVPGVDRVERPVDPATGAAGDELIVPGAHERRLVRNRHGELVAVRLRTGELVGLPAGGTDVDVLPATLPPLAGRRRPDDAR